jgi:hypothetical protein
MKLNRICLLMANEQQSDHNAQLAAKSAMWCKDAKLVESRG